MINLVIDKPYTPIPPHPGRLWPALINLYVPHFLRKHYGITKITLQHQDRLAASLRAGHGVMLTPNHARDEDPFVLSALGKAVGTPFFIVASWHLFMASKLRAFLLRRAGAFSIYREGMDRAALNTSIEILEKASRPLVLFPEGHISRTNDHLNTLLDGTALIARSAAKKRAKEDPNKKVVIHPIALRYTYHGDINAAATQVLDEIEHRLTWRPSKSLPLVDRIYKVGAGLLALKELEYLGHTQSGPIDERLTALINAILTPMEDQYLNGRHDDHPFARVKRLRTAILPDLLKSDLPDPDRDRRWKEIADLYLVQQLIHYPPDYVRSNPTPERLLETVERFEEDLTDKVRPHPPIHATITVGQPIEVPSTRESRADPDPLMTQIDTALHTLLNIPMPPTTEPANTP